MAFTETATQGLPIVDTINFAAANNTNLNSIGVSLVGSFKRLFWIIVNNGLGAAGVINAQLQSSANANFSGLHNMNSVGFTNWNTNVPISTIEVRADQVTQQNAGDKYVRLQLTTTGNALTGVEAVAIGVDAIQKPGGANYTLNSNSVFTQNVCTT
jgi:hypothetical protein